ncbi:MAG TPA: VWA domain-containing protein [Gemmatimonadaceae bacterium]|nr:VWA domain-containing protein [Gemmatimonadaceae bacterium]
MDVPVVGWLALAALPLAAGALAWHHRRRVQRVAQLGTPQAIARLAPAGVGRPPVARVVRLGLALTCVTLGLAGPRWGEGTSIVRAKGLDVAIAMDASLSMTAEDERPSRLQRMRQEVRRYRAASPGDRNALIAFAGKSYILTPLTTDGGAIELYLDNFDPNIVGLAGTAMAPTIIQGTQLLQAANGSASRVLVIMSDGEAFDDHDAAIAAAKAAKKAGIGIVTVGFGTEEGTTIPVRQGADVVNKRDADGEVVITKYDPSFLRDIAEAAGGEFIAATDGDRGGRIARALARMDAEQRDIEEGLSRPLHLAWFLVPAVVLLLLDAWRTDGGTWSRVRRLLHLAAPAVVVIRLVTGAVVAAAPRPADAQGAPTLYREGRFGEAAAAWRRLVEKGDERLATMYNLGTSLLRADSLATAEEALERAAASPESAVRRKALFNLGLSRLKRAVRADEPDRQRAADGAIAAYRALLLEQPDDGDAKWNYELALRARRQAQGGGGAREQPQSAPQESPASPQAPQPTMSRQQAEQLLAAASREERETQARKQAGTRAQRPPGGKEW